MFVIHKKVANGGSECKRRRQGDITAAKAVYAVTSNNIPTSGTDYLGRATSGQSNFSQRLFDRARELGTTPGDHILRGPGDCPRQHCHVADTGQDLLRAGTALVADE